MLQRLIRAPFDYRIPGRHPRVLPQSRGYLAGSPRFAAAGCCAQTKTATTLTEPPRPLLLDLSVAHMAAMVGCSSHCETGDGDLMASGGLSPVLALAIAGARRPAQAERGGSNCHPLHGGLEFGLGSTEDPRELLKLGFEVSERTRRQISATATRRSCQTMAGLPR